MIRLENIFIKVNNQDFLIEDINIFIPSGSLISIIGNPGEGKTKLFKILGLKEKANKGDLFILGKNVNKLSRNELSKLHGEISMVSEDDDLIYNLGVEENIIFPWLIFNYKGKSEKIGLLKKQLGNTQNENIYHSIQLLPTSILGLICC